MSSFVLRNFDAFQTKQTFQIFHKNNNVCCVIRLSRQFADVKAPFIQTFWQPDEDNCRVCRLLSLCVSFSVLQKCSFSIVPSASCCGVCYLGDGDLCVFTEIPRQKSRMNEWIPIMIRSSLVSPYNFYLQKTYIFLCDCSRQIPFLFVITSTDRDRQTWQFLLLNCYSHFHIFVHSSQSLRAIKMAILNYVLFNCLRLFFNSHLHILHFNFRLRTHNKLNTHADGSLLYKTGWRGRYVADMPFHRQFVYSIQTQMSWNWIEIWSAMSLSVVLFNGYSAGCFFVVWRQRKEQNW